MRQRVGDDTGWSQGLIPLRNLVPLSGSAILNGAVGLQNPLPGVGFSGPARLCSVPFADSKRQLHHALARCLIRISPTQT